VVRRLPDRFETLREPTAPALGSLQRPFDVTPLLVRDFDRRA